MSPEKFAKAQTKKTLAKGFGVTLWEKSARGGPKARVPDFVARKFDDVPLTLEATVTLGTASTVTGSYADSAAQVVASFRDLMVDAPQEKPILPLVIRHSGYSDAQFDPKRIRVIARRLAVDIPKLCREENIDFVAVRGRSGDSMGFAALSHTKPGREFRLVSLRKRGVRHHGMDVEGNVPYEVANYGTKRLRWIILDDFVSSGSTVRGMIDDMRDYAENKARALNPELVGILSWQGAYVESYRLKKSTLGCYPGWNYTGV